MPAAAKVPPGQPGGSSSDLGEDILSRAMVGHWLPSELPELAFMSVGYRFRFPDLTSSSVAGLSAALAAGSLHDLPRVLHEGSV